MIGKLFDTAGDIFGGLTNVAANTIKRVGKLSADTLYEFGGVLRDADDEDRDRIYRILARYDRGELTRRQVLDKLEDLVDWRND